MKCGLKSWPVFHISRPILCSISRYIGPCDNGTRLYFKPKIPRKCRQTSLPINMYDQPIKVADTWLAVRRCYEYWYLHDRCIVVYTVWKLRRWGLYQMDAVLQTTFSIALSWMKFMIFMQVLTICHHWLRYCPEPIKKLNQCQHMGSLGHSELTYCL